MSSPVTPLPSEDAQKEIKKAEHQTYVHNDAVALDDLINAFSGGQPDETISSRMARWATEETGWKKHVGTEACKIFNAFQHDHGARAELGDLGRAEGVVNTEESSPTVKAEQEN